MIRSLKRHRKGGWFAVSRFGIDVYAQSAGSAVAWAEVADSFYVRTPVGVRTLHCPVYRPWTAVSLLSRRSANYVFMGG